MRRKKAQGLSMQTVVIAAIVLIVLFVLILIFTGRINIFRQDMESCLNKGGTCKDAKDCDGIRTTVEECQKKGQVCCFTPGG